MSDLGVMPLSWSIVKLHDCVEIHYGKSLPAKERIHTGQIPVVGSSGVVGTHNASIVDGPSLSIGRKGAAGSVHFISRSSWPIDTAYFIQPPDGLSIRWLYYYLGSRELGQLEKSTAIPSLSRDDLYQVETPIAPSSEQTRIIEKLEELLSDLNTGVAELKVAQAKLVRYRQSLLKAAVEGALTAEWRQHNTPEETGAQLLQRFLSERRARWEAKQLAKFADQGKAPPKDWQKKYPEPVQPDTRDLPELPDAWVWTSIGQCFYVGVGATPSRKESNYWNGHISWVSSGEVQFNRIKNTKEKITQEGLNNSSTQINPAGSVMLGMIGEGKTRGQVAILDIEAANNQNCAAIWVSGTEIPSEYVYFWLWSRYEQTRQGSSGNNQPALNKSIVESIPLPLPPLNELNAISDLVGISMDRIKRQEDFIEVSLKQAIAQRKNILRAAFSGQLVPQDPNDEPASALLARIRAGRIGRESKRTHLKKKRNA